MIGTAIRKILTDNSAFSVIAGTSVYPIRITQGKPLPAVVYQIVSNTPAKCKKGKSGADKIRVQLSIFSEKYEQMEALAATVREAMDDYKGTVLGLNIASITYENETDLPANTATVYHKAQDYTITINR